MVKKDEMWSANMDDFIFHSFDLIKSNPVGTGAEHVMKVAIVCPFSETVKITCLVLWSTMRGSTQVN